MSTSFTANTPAWVIKVINVSRSFLFRNCRSCLRTPASDTSLCLWDLSHPSTNSPLPNLLLHSLQQDWNSHENYCCAHTRHEKAAWSFTDTLQGDRDNSHPPWCWLQKLSGVSLRRDRAQLKIQVSDEMHKQPIHSKHESPVNQIKFKA